MMEKEYVAVDYMSIIDKSAFAKYCADDVKITIKLMKNRAYGAVSPVRDIIRASGPYTADGSPWYQVDLSDSASEWLRDLNHPDVTEVVSIGNCFDMPEDIYILTKLKWA